MQEFTYGSAIYLGGKANDNAMYTHSNSRSFTRISMELSNYPGSNDPTPFGSAEMSQNQSNVCRLMRRWLVSSKSNSHRRLNMIGPQQKCHSCDTRRHQFNPRMRSTVTIAQHGSIQAYIHNAAGKIA
jgi:hypothetical protein